MVEVSAYSESEGIEGLMGESFRGPVRESVLSSEMGQ